MCPTMWNVEGMLVLTTLIGSLHEVTQIVSMTCASSTLAGTFYAIVSRVSVGACPSHLTSSISTPLLWCQSTTTQHNNQSQASRPIQCLLSPIPDSLHLIYRFYCLWAEFIFRISGISCTRAKVGDLALLGTHS